jgi:hypothetical protein
MVSTKLSMQKIIVFAGLALSGCAHDYLKENDMEISRWGIGTDLDLSKIEIDNCRDASGNHRVTIEKAKSDQSETAGAIAKGVTEGIASGVKP